MSSPFINGPITVYDEKLNEEVEVNILNVSKYFKNIYCLCLMNNKAEADINIFVNYFYKSNDNKSTDTISFEKTISKLILYKANISILKNNIHFGNICYCPKDKIIGANKFGYELDNNILILPIYNISFLSLQKYIDNINGSLTFDDFYDIMIINNYFGDNIKSESIQLKINYMIYNFDESKYWELSYNCMPNITKLFDNRKFNFNIIRSAPDISNLIEKIDKSPLKENYIEQIFNRRNYVDPSEIINKKGYKLYWKVWKSDYKNEDINKLFDILNNVQKYLLFSNLCVSKKHCHLAINNSYIITMMTPVIHQNISLYAYLFGYAWLRFYFEETINRFRVKTTDMYIFDINTASVLPVFYFNHNVPHSNPYCPILVANKSLNPDINIGGIISNTEKDLKRRICNLDEFKEKMNIFISGNKNINLLDNINFKELKIAITGSIMTACSQYNHPLMNLFLNYPENEKDKRFFDEYYYESDIDVMVMSKSIYEFLDITKSFYEQIMLNCCQYLNSSPEHIKYNLLRTTYLFVSSDFIKEHICTDKLSYEVIVKGIDHKAIINLFVKYAKKMHEMECKKKLEGLTKDEKVTLMEKYKEIFVFEEDCLVIKIKDTKTNTTMINTKPLESEFSQEEIEMILNSNNNLDEEKINIIIPMVDGLGFSDSFKIRITAPQLSRDFELFPVYKDDFMNTVANFHMPCVRAYYNGDTVYMTPSFISAHMTLMNIDYKYFAGSKDPINIINKYRMRGFGCWLNKNELETYIKYNYEVPFWNNMFNINPNNKNTYSKCYGPLTIYSNMYKPRIINKDLIVGEKITPVESDYSMPAYTILSEQEYNISRFGSNKVFNKTYTTINKSTGYIEPLFKELIQINGSYLSNPTMPQLESDDNIEPEQLPEFVNPNGMEFIEPVLAGPNIGITIIDDIFTPPQNAFNNPVPIGLNSVLEDVD